jgi:hypothetical protein
MDGWGGSRGRVVIGQGGWKRVMWHAALGFCPKRVTTLVGAMCVQI